MATNGSRARTTSARAHRIPSSSYNNTSGHGNGASSGGSTSEADCVAVRPLVEELTSTVAGAIKRIAELADEVRGIADRLLGSEASGQAGFEEPQVTGQAYAAMQGVRHLLDSITSLESEVRRLHRL